MCNMELPEGKIEKKAKWALASYFHLHNTLSLPEGVHKIWKHWLQ